MCAWFLYIMGGMKTKTITIEVTPDDMFEILYALEAEINREINHTGYGKITKHNYREELDCYNLVNELTRDYLYSFTIPYTKFSEYKTVYHLDEFIEALIDMRDKKAREEKKKI